MKTDNKIYVTVGDYLA